MKQPYCYLFLILVWLSGCATEPEIPATPKPTTIPIIKPSPSKTKVAQPSDLHLVPPPRTQVIPMPVPPAITSPSSSFSHTGLPHAAIVPGGVVWIPLSSQSSTPPSLIYNQRRVVVVRDQQQWVALVGIPLDASVGQHAVIDQQTASHYSFEVVNKNYKSQYLKFKMSTAEPDPEVLERIRREAEIIKAAFATPWRATTSLAIPLEQPVHGRISSAFGLRRFINGEPRKPHSGLDIAAPVGTAVLAPADGVVVNTGRYLLTGNTILIDHGQSVVTMYGHLSSIAVQTGQWVSRGQTIGRVGKTGRATGPHLHWAVSLNSALVDPTLLVAK